MGDPGRLAIGSPAFVIGHPFGLTGSLSAGVISGLDRSLNVPGKSAPLTGLIQFDAAVNPGNSGGPLVDENGEVVGIVTGLVNPAGQKLFSGVGFAVTIDQAAGALGLPPD
jgi:S1-C subfamily serine protease